MTTEDILKPSPEIQRQLDSPNSPLASYARTLRSYLEREREQSWQLVASKRQLEAEIRDLKASAEAGNRRVQEVEEAYFDAVIRLTKASEYKDPESGAHIIRMSRYAETLALHLDLGEEYAKLMLSAAPMHDIGKIGVPDVILLKEGPLNSQEWELMKKHTIIGARILEGSKSLLLKTASQIARTHHERWDGSGYPAGLKGDAIPMVGRIVMLADCYDALRSERPYKKGVSHAQALDALTNGDERSRPEHFDPKLLGTLSEVHEQFDDIFSLFID